MQGSTFPDVEPSLVQWLKKARTRSLPITGPRLIEKTQCSVLQLNHEDFLCSSYWLARLRARDNLSMQVVSGEASAADDEGGRRRRMNDRNVAGILNDCVSEDIFNIDESVLF